MNAPPSGDSFSSFDDLFGKGFFSSPLQGPEHGDSVQFYTLDRMLIVPDPAGKNVVLILRDSHMPHAHGYGVGMTVREATQAIGLLRQAIDRIEEVPQVIEAPQPKVQFQDTPDYEEEGD